MNIFFFFFLTTAVVTAAPHVSPTSSKHQSKSGKPGNSSNHECHRKSRIIDRKHLLREIIANVKDLKTNLTEKVRFLLTVLLVELQTCNQYKHRILLDI